MASFDGSANDITLPIDVWKHFRKRLSPSGLTHAIREMAVSPQKLIHRAVHDEWEPEVINTCSFYILLLTEMSANG